MDEIQIKQKADSLAHKFIITDGHIDVPHRLFKKMEDISVRTEEGEFDFERAVKGGLNAPFMSIYTAPELYAEGKSKIFADSLIDMVAGIAEKHSDKFALANSPSDVIRNTEKGLISLPMGMENGSPIEEDLANLEYFYNRGIRYITLAHSKNNQICDSSYDTTRTWNGLSPFGVQVVEEMNRLGIMIDVSHISDETFEQVINRTKAPVIASHSSCRKFTPGWERNMSDEMIKTLAENGGVIQINFGSAFLDSTALANHLFYKKTVADNGLDEHDEEYRNNFRKDYPVRTDVNKVADHIDHVKNLVGVDHVAFGSDFDGVGDTLPDGLKDVSFYPNLIYQLLKRGYTEEEIEKICYKNVFRVWEKVEEVAGSMKES